MSEPQICTWCRGKDGGCGFCRGTGFNIEGTDLPVCPHCGAEHSDDDPFTENYYEGYKCEECGESFDIEVCTTVTYNTSKSG